MGSGVSPSVEAPGHNDHDDEKESEVNTHLVAHEQYPSPLMEEWVHGRETVGSSSMLKKCSIARSYHSTECIAACTSVADLAGRLPAG